MDENADVATPTDRTASAVVCTLADGPREARTLEWADLGAHALSRERLPAGVASTYPIELADQIEDLANREVACCGSWLDTKTARIGPVIRVELTTSSREGLDLILSLAGVDE